MRRRAGLTAVQLAERMHCTKTTVYFWETGRTWPNAALLPELAETLGCTIDDLFADHGEENTTQKEERP